MTTTIHVTGFPPDALPRELKNLCRFLVGYEGAHVAFAGPGSMEPNALFVKFATTELAGNALEVVNGAHFDVDTQSHVLRAEYARREMEVRNTTLSVAVQTPGYGDVGAPMYGDTSTGASTGTLGAPAASMSVPQAGAWEEIVTITLLALRDKGLVKEEVSQWFQQQPGFAKLQINERIGGMFIKFDTRYNAEAALAAANGMNWDAQWARRNLDDDLGAKKAAAVAAMPVSPMATMAPVVHMPQMAPAFSDYGAFGGAAVPQGGAMEEVVTITVLALRDKGLRFEDVSQWFQQQPGFLKLQMNERIGGMFIKFDTRFNAEQALQNANALQWDAQWARRNLDDDLSARHAPIAAAAPIVQAQPIYNGHGAYGGAPPVISGLEDIVTIALLAYRDKGLTADDVSTWFQQQPGFKKLQINERIGAIFIKFDTRLQAEQALSAANASNWGCDWARRNLDDDLGARGAAVAGAPPPVFAYAGTAGPAKRPRPVGGEIDTIAVVGMKEKGLSSQELQRFFQSQPGFLVLQVNEKIGSLFCKFDSRMAAEQAIQAAANIQIRAEWALRNLNL